VSPLLLVLLVCGSCTALLVFFGQIDLPAPSATRGTTPRLRVVVTDATYRYGHLRVGGTVENVGDADAPDPRITIRVRGEDWTLLAEESVWPAGANPETLPRGSTAAFDSVIRVPGDPPRAITYEVRVDRLAHEVRYEVVP
jgi:hypothetical protein